MARPRKEDKEATNEVPETVVTQADYEENLKAIAEGAYQAADVEPPRGVPYKLHGSDCYRTDY